MVRRDSILKHSGSVKNTDRRVSIKQNQPVIVEYLSEKRPSQTTVHSQSHTNTTIVGNARPASLILTKGERPSFKLIRSPSIDNDQDDVTLINIRSDTPNLLVNSLSINSGKEDDDDDESMPLVQNNGKDTTSITSSGNNLANL